MISLRQFNLIVDELRRIEQEHDVRILYACESGSRAWGFASRDSDYDVRFIYAHAPDWYQSLDERRDVIEVPIDAELDLSGWDLRKALRLMRKSNPALIEWLKSPVIYAMDEEFMAEFRPLAAEHYSPTRVFHHYRHMAYGNARRYLHGDTIWLKKYLYVLRPILACRWIEQGRGEPPMLFDHLVEATVDDAALRDAIAGLLVLKKTGDELGEAPRIGAISDFIDAELPRLDALGFHLDEPPATTALSEFYRRHCLGLQPCALAA